MPRPKHAPRGSSPRRDNVFKSPSHNRHEKKTKPSQVRIPLRKNGLALMDASGQVEKHYSYTKQGQRERRSILAELIRRKQGGALTVMRALVARRTLGKNRMEEKSWQRISSDIEWVKKKYENTDQWSIAKESASYASKSSASKSSAEKSYSTDLTRRRKFLQQEVRREGSALKVWRRLHALRNFGKDLKGKKKQLGQDMLYLKETFQGTPLW